MMRKMSEGEEPCRLMDEKLTAFEQRYTDLVTQDTGAIDTLAAAVKNVRDSVSRKKGTSRSMIGLVSEVLLCIQCICFISYHLI